MADVDYINRTLSVERQLGRVLNTRKEDFAPKTFTKQEIRLKTSSSRRELPIPDYVFEAILEERKIYEKRRSRRRTSFQDLDYICCSGYGRPRSKDFQMFIRTVPILFQEEDSTKENKSSILHLYKFRGL